MIAAVIGTLAGSYRIVDTISVGGMGTVYRAEHTLLGRVAAVKVLNPEMSTSRDIVNRFFNEARATTSIKHPGIIEVFDFGYLPSGHAYLVMEFLEGAPLSVRNKARGVLPEFEAAAILRGICSALTAAHAKGIVHRDLKPDNIFMVPDPDSMLGERPKVLDFGIAKLTDIGLAGSATKTGAVMGTPTYMSPEQCRGTGDVDHRADLYSLGCIFYELITGRPPFTDRGAGELIGAHLFMQPEPPSRHMPGVSAETEALIMALLAKSPAERPQTAAELGQRLAPIAARGGFGSAASWDGIRPSMPYAVAQPGDATRYPTPGGSMPMPTPGGSMMPGGGPMLTPRPLPTPMGQPMPTPMGQPMPTPMGQPMPTPMGHPMATPMGQPMPTPMGQPMATPMRTPGVATTSDPTTLSGAASQVAQGGGSGKRIFAIAGIAVLVGAAALFFAFGRGGGGDDTKAADQPAVKTGDLPTTHVEAPAPAEQKPVDPPTPVEAAKPVDPPKPVEAAKPIDPPKPVDSPKPVETAKPAVVTKPADTAKPAVAAKPADTTKPADTVKPTKPATASKPTKPTKPAKPSKNDNPLLETDVD